MSTFTIQCPIPSRERILVFGVGGTGKSKGLLDIARKVTDGKFYIMDNDLSYERMLYTEYTDVAERGNFRLELFEQTDWSDYVPTIREWSQEATQNDWLSLDSVTPTWDAVQGWYTDALYGKDKADYMIKVRQETKNDREYNKAMRDSMNFSVINAEYFKLYAALARWPGHVYLTAEQATISEDDDKEVQGTFGPVGYKPKGQKGLGHRTSTVLWLTRNRLGEWQMTSVKDRGRKLQEKAPHQDFAADYLQTVAGWRMKKVE